MPATKLDPERLRNEEILVRCGDDLSVRGAVEAGSCPTEPVSIMFHGGYLTNEECRALPAGTLHLYMIGFVNGLYMSPALGAPSECLQRLGECFVGVTGTQLEAVMRNWLDENPQRWHELCQFGAYAVISEMCPRK